MNCEQTQNFMLENLSADGDKFHPEFQAHLEACPSCEQEWVGMRELSRQFSRLEPVFPSLTSLRRLQEKARSAPVSLWATLSSQVRAWLSPVLAPALQWAPLLMLGFVVLTTCLVMLTSGPDRDSLASSDLPVQVRQPQTFQYPHHVQTVAQMPTQQFNDPNFLAELPGLPTVDPILPPVEAKPDLEQQYQLRVQSLLEADADELLMRGRRFKSMGRMDLALRDFETIHSFYPQYTYMGDVLMYRAQCYGFQGEVDKAVASLKEYAKLYPEKESLVLPMIDQLEAARP